MAGGDADNARSLFSWLSCLLVSRLLSSWHLEQTPHCAAFRLGRVLGRLQPFQAWGWITAPCKLCLLGLLPVPVTCLAGLGEGKSCWYHCVLGWGVWIWSSGSSKEERAKGFLQFFEAPPSSGKAAARRSSCQPLGSKLGQDSNLACGAAPGPGSSGLWAHSCSAHSREICSVQW